MLKALSTEVDVRWTDRLERHFGWFAVPGLGRLIVGLQALCFVLGVASPDIVDALVLKPQAALSGDYWRFFTFLAVPSLTPLNILLALFFLMFQWSVFEALEAEWGAFRLTLYCAMGWFCALALPVGAWLLAGYPLESSGGYWSTSILLAFAFLFPDYTIYVYFILPMKMRWMAWIIGAYLLLRIFTGGVSEAMLIGVGLANYLVFFAGDFKNRYLLHRQVQQGRQVFLKSKKEAEWAPRTCARCGAGSEAGLRLCTCPVCGSEGKDWCDAHLGAHLAESPAAPLAPGSNPASSGSAIAETSLETPAPKPKGRPRKTAALPKPKAPTQRRSAKK
jgi:hypothetical protein